VNARLVGPLPARSSRTIFRITASLGFAALASAIAWFGIRINAWYGVTLGKTDDASSLIAGLSVSADILALFLPAAARTLWVEGYRGGSAAAWALWTMTVAITLMATLGFAALNIADTTAARGKIAAESMGLQTRLDQLRAERATIAESRSVATIDAELQRAQPGAATVWRPTAGCRDVTLPNLVKPARPFWRCVKRSERRDGATRSKSIYAMPRHNSHACRPSRPPIPRLKLPQTWSAGRHSGWSNLPLTTFAWLALPGWS
jgi:hypothetical protein